MSTTRCIYVGRIKRLQGLEALVMRVGGKLHAQFTDLNSGYAYGWHLFDELDFVTWERLAAETKRLQKVSGYGQTAAKQKALSKFCR